MKPYTRAVHFDFHTMPGIQGLLSNFDAEEFAERLKNCHVQFINFPARCNIGFSYYDTKVGIKYEGLQRDILREVLDACHKRDIGVAVYINGGLNHELAYRRPDFCRQNEQGNVIVDDVKDNFFRTMCWNTGYKQHFFAELQEILSYGVDGIFIDCVQQKVCYCPECVKKMKEEGVDITSPTAVLDYQQSLILKLYKEIKEFVGDDIYLYINSNVSVQGVHTHAEVECLPSSKLWGADYFYPASSFERTRFAKKVYMTGRFQDCWGDFGGVKTVESMQNDLYDAMLSGYDFTIADHLHPVDGFYKEVSDRIAKVMAEKMLYEPFTANAEYISEIAVIADEDDRGAPEYLKGVARMLNELKLPYDVFLPTADFSSKKLVIIPKKVKGNKIFYDRLKEFDKVGKKIVFVGSGNDIAVETGLDKGVTIVGEDNLDNAYFTFNGSDIPYSTYVPSRIIKNNGGKELSKYVAGRFNFIYDGVHSYFYRPQGEVTEYSACVISDNRAYVCYDAFLAYAQNFLKENKLLFGTVVDELLPDRNFKTYGLPSYSIVSLTKSGKNTVLHLKLTHPTIRNGRGIIEEHSYLKDAKLWVKGACKVYELPSLKEIPSVTEDNGTTFTATHILGYKAFLLKF